MSDSGSDDGVESVEENEVVVEELDDVEEEIETFESDEEEQDESESGSENEDDAEDDTKSIASKIINAPKLSTGNTVHVKSLSRKVVPREERNTSNFISTNELAGVIAMRAEQIAHSSVAYVPMTTPDCIILAKKEIMMRRCPIIIARQIDVIDGIPLFEDWSVNEMSFPLDFKLIEGQ